MIPAISWVFQARLDRVIDGDTVHLTVDLGMHDYRTEAFRLARINCPEMSSQAGVNAKLFTQAWLQSAMASAETFTLIIQTHKTDTWGRYIAEVWRKLDGRNLSDELLSSNHAVPWP